jgi:hypothetical protein
MVIPGGMSSEAVVKESRFCVQTEFAHRPKPRVTTTISLNGEVVEKVDTNWPRSPLTDEDKKDIEEFLKKQHQKVMQKMGGKNDQPAPQPGNRDDQKPANEDAVLRVDQMLSQTEGVRGWAFILKDGQILAHRISDPEDKKQLKQIKDFSSILSESTSLGSLRGGILHLPDSLSVFMPVKDHFLGIKLDRTADPQGLTNRIKDLI